MDGYFFGMIWCVFYIFLNTVFLILQDKNSVAHSLKEGLTILFLSTIFIFPSLWVVSLLSKFIEIILLKVVVYL